MGEAAIFHRHYRATAGDAETVDLRNEMRKT